MKQVTLSIVIVLITISVFAQSNIDINAANNNSQVATSPVRYRLYPTENMWTFIKLNTRNGRMWQVQYDVQGDNRFETYLTLLPLVDKEDEVDDRFALFPTQNIYNFILLDQIGGKTWQVQWSIEPQNRSIWPIE